MANKSMTEYLTSLVIKDIKIKKTDEIPCFSDQTGITRRKQIIGVGESVV